MATVLRDETNRVIESERYKVVEINHGRWIDGHIRILIFILSKDYGVIERFIFQFSCYIDWMKLPSMPYVLMLLFWVAIQALSCIPIHQWRIHGLLLQVSIQTVRIYLDLPIQLMMEGILGWSSTYIDNIDVCDESKGKIQRCTYR